MALSWPAKDPNEVKDYSIDWSDWLATGDTISTSAWSVVGSGLTTSSLSNTTTTTKIWLSGGEVGTIYYLTNRIVTADGRTADQTVSIEIRSR